jgi:hypothetical protein
MIVDNRALNFPIHPVVQHKIEKEENVKVEQIDNQENIAQKEKLLRRTLINNLALTLLKELAAITVMAGAACFFIAKPAIPRLVKPIITILAISILLKTIQGLIAYDIRRILIRGGQIENIKFFYLKDFLHVYARISDSALIALIDDVTHGVLIHEIGHTLAASLFFRTEGLKIEIYPFLKGGATSFKIMGLTRLGKWLGEERSFIVMVAAGPAFAILDATVLLGIAHLVKEKHPKLHLNLISIAVMRIFTHVLYAISALKLTGADLEGHDFYILWKKAGIHPRAAAVAMVAIPLLFQCTLWKISAYRQAHQAAAAA